MDYRDSRSTVRAMVLANGEGQSAMTSCFLISAGVIQPAWNTNGGPYRSSGGLGAWPLAYYGLGSGRLGDYRSTLMLEQDGTYSHLLFDEDGETDIQRSGLGPGGNTEKTVMSPSLFVTDVVRLTDDGDFTVVGPAWDGESGSEPLVDVLVRSLTMIITGVLPPLFLRSATLRH